MKTHEITSQKTGKVYEVRKLRTEESFNLPVWHYRRVGDGPQDWRPLATVDGMNTLAGARRELHAS